MGFNFNNLVGIGVVFGDKDINWPYNISITTLGVFKDRNDQYSYSMIPSQDIDYLSGDASIVTVNDNGIITPINIGITTIHITVKERADIDCLIYCNVIQGYPLGFSMGVLGLIYS